MANLTQTGFNVADAPEASGDFAPIPAGDYPMRVVSSKMKDTKSGQMLVLEMDITDGPSAGRKHWENFNLINTSQQAVEIAQRSLAQLCTAVGKLSIEDSEELHMLPFIGKIKVTPPKDGYPAGNGIAGYKSAEGGASVSSQQSAQSDNAGTVTNGKPNATKGPDGKYYSDDGTVVPPFRLSAYNKIG